MIAFEQFHSGPMIGRHNASGMLPVNLAVRAGHDLAKLFVEPSAFTGSEFRIVLSQISLGRLPFTDESFLSMLGLLERFEALDFGISFFNQFNVAFSFPA